MFKKGIDVIVPLFDVTLCLLMLHSLRLPYFPFRLLRVRGGRRIACLYSCLTHCLFRTCSCPRLPAQVKPLITQVYTRRQHPPVSSPPPVASTSDPVLSDDLPIALRKGKRQCAYPISSFFSYDHLSSHSYSFIASLILFRCLTRFLKPSLTLVDVVL